MARSPSRPAATELAWRRRACAIAFVAIALFVPIRQPDEPPSPTEHAVETLEEQLETLDDVAGRVLEEMEAGR